jgi:c-di-GMP-binding flagellar brake protein YcgR
MSGRERRRLPRLPLNAEVEYSVPDQEETELFTTESRNISSVGVCIIVFERLEQGTILDLKFPLPQLNKFIITKGRVAWIREFSIRNKKVNMVYEAGIEFINIKDTDRQELEKYILGRTKNFIAGLRERFRNFLSGILSKKTS